MDWRGHRRRGRAEDGAAVSGRGVGVMAVGLFGPVEPLELGYRLPPCRGHLGPMSTQLNEQQGELLGLSGTTGR